MGSKKYFSYNGISTSSFLDTTFLMIHEVNDFAFPIIPDMSHCVPPNKGYHQLKQPLADLFLFLPLLTLSLPRVPLIDFTLSNARRFYSSMGNPMGVKGLRENYRS